MRPTVFALVVFLLCSPAAFTTEARADNYANTIDVFKSSPVVKPFFDNSYGYALFPTVGKAGFIIGGGYGRGQVYRDDRVTGKTSIIEGSLGFQLGGKAFRQIIFFQDQNAYNKFTRGNFEFDATVQAVIVTAGIDAQAGTGGKTVAATAGPKTGVQGDISYVNGMAIFLHTLGGLMGELSVGGQKFSFEPL